MACNLRTARCVIVRKFIRWLKVIYQIQTILIETQLIYGLVRPIVTDGERVIVSIVLRRDI